MPVLLARLSAAREARDANFRVELRRVGCVGSIVRTFAARSDALEWFHRQRTTSPADIVRLTLAERDDGGRWVERSTSSVGIAARRRDLHARGRHRRDRRA